MKNKNKALIITLITVCTVLIISLMGLMIFLLNTNWNKSFNFSIGNKVSKKLVLNKEYANNFKKIDITSYESNISIKESKDEKIHVEIYGKEKNLDVSDNNNELTINYKSSVCIGFCFNIESNRIIVYLPSSYQEKISIKNNYGDINIGKFLNANTKIDTSSGDIKVLSSNNVTIKNDYGDIKIEKANKANINVSSGDIEIGEINDITIKNSYGDTEIGKILNFLDIECASGDIDIYEVLLNQDSKIICKYGDIHIKGINEIYVDAKTDYGEIDIEKNYRKSNITLSIKNNSGDITINK